MKSWQRIGAVRKCGLCGVRFERGAVLLAISGGSWTKWRCTGCAGEKPPADIPPLAEITREQTMTRISALRSSLPFDFKAAQTGERE